MEAQWLMLQQAQPEDFVIATGKQYSVRDFVNLAAQKLELKLAWQGSGADEHAVDAKGRKVVAVDRRYFRPAEVDTLLGDPSKAKAKLGWTARTPFDTLVDEMVRADLREAERDALVTKHGHVVHRPYE